MLKSLQSEPKTDLPLPTSDSITSKGNKQGEFMGEKNKKSSMNFVFISCHTQSCPCANFFFPFLLLASTHKSDCHPVEDVGGVRDELRSVTDWKTLGEELQVPRQVLDNIDSDNPRAERKIIETIRAWFNIKEKPCWEMVVRALKRMLQNKLASEIAGRHGVNYNEV